MRAQYYANEVCNVVQRSVCCKFYCSCIRGLTQMFKWTLLW